MDYNFEEINQRIKNVTEILFKNDIFLLENDVNERSISHKLAEYLQQQFPDWNVDCEYNRKLGDIKKLMVIRKRSKRRSATRIYPDIIIHKRNEKTKNLLVIEIKKIKNKGSKFDKEKLKLFTSENEGYKYKFGLFIKLNKSKEPILIWFKEGREFLNEKNPA